MWHAGMNSNRAGLSQQCEKELRLSGGGVIFLHVNAMPCCDIHVAGVEGSVEALSSTVENTVERTPNSQPISSEL